MSSSTTWFTAKRMKTFACVIVAVDIILLVAWVAISVYIAFNLNIECFHDVSINHFLIVVHFILGIHLSTMITEISKEERIHSQRSNRPLARLPYYMYEPLPWIMTSLVSFSGDIILLVWGVIDYSQHPSSDECNNARIVHISFDVIALLTSLVSIIWFILFAVLTIREERPTNNNVLNV